MPVRHPGLSPPAIEPPVLRTPCKPPCPDMTQGPVPGHGSPALSSRQSPSGAVPARHYRRIGASGYHKLDNLHGERHDVKDPGLPDKDELEPPPVWCIISWPSFHREVGDWIFRTRLCVVLSCIVLLLPCLRAGRHFLLTGTGEVGRMTCLKIVEKLSLPLQIR